MSTDGGQSLVQEGLLGALDQLKSQLPPAPQPTRGTAPGAPAVSTPVKKRGRVELRRLKAGKGGKIVTEISNFAAISPQELEQFTLSLKKLCGVGGTLKDRTIELQGDQRERAAAWLQERGFTPVRAGG